MAIKWSEEDVIKAFSDAIKMGQNTSSTGSAGRTLWQQLKNLTQRPKGKALEEIPPRI